MANVSVISNAKSIAQSTVRIESFITNFIGLTNRHKNKGQSNQRKTKITAQKHRFR